MYIIIIWQQHVQESQAGQLSQRCSLIYQVPVSEEITPPEEKTCGCRPELGAGEVHAGRALPMLRPEGQNAL